MAQKKLIEVNLADLTTIQTNIEFAAETVSQINKLQDNINAEVKKILQLTGKYVKELNTIERQINKFDLQLKSLGIDKGFVEALVEMVEKLPSETAVGTLDNALKNVTTFGKL
jgi:hypothetical protein